MDLVTEPIFHAHVLLDANEAFRRVEETTRKYRIKTIDSKRRRIVFDTPYLYSFFLYVTWIKEIVVTVTPVTEEESAIEAYGKPVLSPHHLFLTPVFSARRIDRNVFATEISEVFHGCTVDAFGRELKPKKRINNAVFYFLEALSVLLLLHIFVTRVLLDRPQISISSWIIIALFLLTQALLIVLFTRDCYRSAYVALSAKPRWISFIASTGFIGAGFYFFMVYRRNRGTSERQAPRR
jgi:hypothetical protein